MTWQRVKYSRIAKDVKSGVGRRTLVTWQTDAGEMFAHGVICAGPEKVKGEDRVYFYLGFDDRSGALPKWNFSPHPTYGFRPKGSDVYLSAQQLGVGAWVALGTRERVYFEAHSARQNRLRFYEPTTTPDGEVGELPGGVAMYECMLKYGWRRREDWGDRIRDDLERKRNWTSDKASVQLAVADLAPEETLVEAAEIIKRHLNEMELMLSGEQLYERKSIWEMWGLASRIHRLRSVDVIELIHKFDSMVYSVTSKGKSVSEMPWAEDRNFLRSVSENLRIAQRVEEGKIFAKRVADAVSDEAWATELRMREFLVRGNTVSGWLQLQGTADS